MPRSTILNEKLIDNQENDQAVIFFLSEAYRRHFSLFHRGLENHERSCSFEIETEKLAAAILTMFLADKIDWKDVVVVERKIYVQH